MSNNKLKNMIENHELDDFVYEEKLKEKLCKLQTSEEVLELLKKYNYNESKEIFEVELMDLLKEFVDEEELLKVSGSGADRRNFSKMITSLALAGTLCVPAQAISLEQTSKLTTADCSQKLSEEKFITIPKAPKTPHICRLRIDNAGKYHYICSRGLPPKEQLAAFLTSCTLGSMVFAGILISLIGG